jgi:hypothetical protein
MIKWAICSCIVLTTPTQRKSGPYAQAFEAWESVTWAPMLDRVIA